MSKIKTALLNAAALVLFPGFTGAGPVAPAGAAAGLTAVFAPQKAPALNGLLALLPEAEPPAAPDVEDMLLPEPVFRTGKVIEPGRDLLPKVEDAVRVKAVLKLISDIYNHAPLPYPQDGAVFTNREGKLPRQPLGFYREYTLLTGDAPHTVVIGGQTWQVAPDTGPRGSERIVIGGGEFLYYTPDHYVNFIQLTVVR